MRKNLKKKIRESLFAVLPVTIIVLIINFAFLRMDVGMLAF